MGFEPESGKERGIGLQNQSKIRPFSWRDLPRLRRLQTQGVALDYERALIHGVYPLREALLAYLSLGARGARTMMMSGEATHAAFVQFRYQSEERVRLSYLSPAPADEHLADGWVELLDGLTAAIGGPGAHHFVAEARQDGPELEILQRAGFGTFARQELFRLAQPQGRGAESTLPAELRPWRPSDNWGIRLLYANTVPHLVQRIEPPTVVAEGGKRRRQGFVLEKEGEIQAFVAVRRGRRASAMRFLLHPKADSYAEALIQRGVTALAKSSDQPVYCWVRRYQGCLGRPLERAGFERIERMVSLVKHTVAWVKSPAWKPVPVVESQVRMTTPYTMQQER